MTEVNKLDNTENKEKIEEIIETIQNNEIEVDENLDAVNLVDTEESPVITKVEHEYGAD